MENRRQDKTGQKEESGSGQQDRTSEERGAKQSDRPTGAGESPDDSEKGRSTQSDS